MKTYKRIVTKIDSEIGNAKKDGLFGFDRDKPYYSIVYKILDRERAVFKYFKTEAEAITFRDKIQSELKEGVYNGKTD